MLVYSKVEISLLSSMNRCVITNRSLAKTTEFWIPSFEKSAMSLFSFKSIWKCKIQPIYFQGSLFSEVYIWWSFQCFFSWIFDPAMSLNFTFIAWYDQLVSNCLQFPFQARKFYSGLLGIDSDKSLFRGDVTEKYLVIWSTTKIKLTKFILAGVIRHNACLHLRLFRSIDTEE